MTPRAESDFNGFRPDALAFLRQLERHNERSWFEANRHRYDGELRAPLGALVEEVDVRLATIAPEIVGHPKRSLFRIHRDVRFTSDKRPYKTSVAAWFHHGDAGRGVGAASVAHGGAGFWVEIGAARSSLGGGIWMPPRPTLARLRAAIDDDHESLREIIETPSVVRRFGGLDADAMLKRMPRGFDAAHPAAELLRHQSFTQGRALADRDVISARLPVLLAREFERLVPLVRWLNAALGLRTLARR